MNRTDHLSSPLLVLAVIGVIGVIGAPRAAVAYESECRPGNARNQTIEASVCAGVSVPACAYGLEAARGTLFGEHTWLAAEAMKRAGLAQFTHPADAAAHPVLDYFIAGTTVPGTAGESGEPSDPTVMR